MHSLVKGMGKEAWNAMKKLERLVGAIYRLDAGMWPGVETINTYI